MGEGRKGSRWPIANPFSFVGALLTGSKREDVGERRGRSNAGTNADALVNRMNTSLVNERAERNRNNRLVQKGDEQRTKQLAARKEDPSRKVNEEEHPIGTI